MNFYRVTSIKRMAYRKVVTDEPVAYSSIIVGADNDLIATALIRLFIGTPYIIGTNDLNYEIFEYVLPRNTSNQMINRVRSMVSELVPLLGSVELESVVIAITSRGVDKSFFSVSKLEKKWVMSLRPSESLEDFAVRIYGAL